MAPDWSRLRQYLLPCGPGSAEADFARQASVLALIWLQPQPQLLYTLRAPHLTRHAGEVAFPGGMWEPGDTSLIDTALRETWEEIGLPAAAVELLGAWHPRHTLAGTLVHPFVGLVTDAWPLKPDPGELDAIFQVPLAAFEEGLQVRTDCFERQGKILHVPAYHYQHYEIWGFTAALTRDLLQLLARAGLSDRLGDAAADAYTAPEFQLHPQP